MQSDRIRSKPDGSVIFVRPHLAPRVLRALEEDRGGPDNPVIAAERVALVDRLTKAIRATEPIDLAESRSLAVSEHDGQSPTTAGYLLGLIRDRFASGISEWDDFVALGALAADLEATA